MSALILARLILTVQRALEEEVELSSIECYTDSQVALIWITRKEREWKQFVQNRVNEIREFLPVAIWKHCPGTVNPADMPSRGIPVCELQEKRDLWLHGPVAPVNAQQIEVVEFPDDSLRGMKARDQKTHSLSLLATSKTPILTCEDFSTLKKLLRVTAYVQRFIRSVRKKPMDISSYEITGEEISSALIYWIKIVQSSLLETKEFKQWKQQFQLILDEHGVWKCGRRLQMADIPQPARHPIILCKDHHLAELIVRDCHEKVMHGGVKATMAELRSRYWVVRGRQLVRSILRKCVICRRFQGKSYSSSPPPPLPSFRVQEAQPFSFTDVDYAGPLFMRDSSTSVGAQKVWICLYTCCVTRAVHLDLVGDLMSVAFIQCFKRFSAQRGFPIKMISDNAKAFKGAERILRSIAETSAVADPLGFKGVKWIFNVKRAPWWGGLFKRMIQTVKRCLRKILGNARLTYEELLTAVIEVEMIVNSRPITYITSDDVEEPLTPSRLLCGYRVLSLPDPVVAVESSNVDFNISRSDLTRRLKHLNKVLKDFWERWKTEHLLELREAHRHARKPRGVDQPVNVGDIVVVHDDVLPRGLWKMGRAEELLTGTDGNVRGVTLKIARRGASPLTTRRPIERLFPLECTSSEDQNRKSSKETADQVYKLIPEDPDSSTSPSHLEDMILKRPKRQAFL